ASVFDQECQFPFEVIVVDSSGDDTATLVQERFPKTRVLALPQRAFPGSARNAGLEIARGQFFAFTDTDCVVDRRWLHFLVAAHHQGYPVVGGLVRNGTPYSLFGTLDYLLECSDLMTPHASTDKDHFGTGNVSFSRGIYDEFGPFASQIKGSDNMYFRKIHGAGLTLYWEPKAVIWHRNRTRLRKILRNQYELGIGAAQNRRKNPLRGRIFIRYPLLLPLMPLVRTGLIGERLLRYSPLNFLKFLLLLPLVLLCLIWYTVGFWRGCRSPLDQTPR
ncbi:MAG TPA: glycosyltransferase, partial [bacterium]|nr:glycosyltransferase [bacterium]